MHRLTYVFCCFDTNALRILIASRLVLLWESWLVYIAGTSCVPVLGRVLVYDGFESFLFVVHSVNAPKRCEEAVRTKVQKLSFPSRCFPATLQPGTVMTLSL
jgi:hypothetical protein